MEINKFFKEHTFYVWDDFLNLEVCRHMTKQVMDVYNKGLHQDTNPKFYDNIIQSNTNHIEKQGYTRKYKAFYGDDVRKLTPLIYEYYTNPSLISILSEVAGCKLHTVPTYKTVDQAVQIYNAKGDGTNWHHDRSIFNNGRSFTFLTVIHNTSNQNLTVWTEKFGKEEIKWEAGKAVLIEKFTTFHSVTPLDYGERILLTLTYSEIPYQLSILNPKQYVLNKAKNYGYLGYKALDVIDFLIFCIIITLITISIICVVKLYNTV